MYKKVTTVKWFASDGTECASENEALKYEMRLYHELLATLKGHAAFVDACCADTAFPAGMTVAREMLAGSWFFKVCDEIGLGLINQVFEKNAFITEVGNPLIIGTEYIDNRWYVIKFISGGPETKVKIESMSLDERRVHLTSIISILNSLEQKEIETNEK